MNNLQRNDDSYIAEISNAIYQWIAYKSMQMSEEDARKFVVNNIRKIIGESKPEAKQPDVAYNISELIQMIESKDTLSATEISSIGLKIIAYAEKLPGSKKKSNAFTIGSMIRNNPKLYSKYDILTRLKQILNTKD
jgi:hypothetical protein